MDISSLLSENVKKTSGYPSKRPSVTVSRTEEYKFTGGDIDDLIDRLMEHEGGFDDEEINKIYTIYVSLRESRFLDNYMYLYFDDNEEKSLVGIETLFYSIISDYMRLILDHDEERIEFMEVLEKRVSRIRFVRQVLHHFPEIRREDNNRYINVTELEESMLDLIDIKKIYVTEGPESERLVPSAKFWQPEWDDSLGNMDDIDLPEWITEPI